MQPHKKVNSLEYLRGDKEIHMKLDQEFMTLKEAEKIAKKPKLDLEETFREEE